MSLFWLTMALYNVLVVAGILLVLWRRPRFLLHSAPPAFRTLVPPLTDDEEKERRLWSGPLLLVMLGMPFGYLVWSAATLGPDFLRLWGEAYLLLISFNLVDWLLVDWLVVCWWTPKFVVIPGTEGHPAYKDYGFHFKGFLKGTVLLAVVSLMLTLLSWGTAMLFI